MNDDLIVRLRQIEESTYSLGQSITQVRKIAGNAADRIEELERKQQIMRSAIQKMNEEIK